MVNTILCPCSCGITTYLVRNKINKPKICVRSDYLGITSGISAGLVAITAGCNCVQPWASICIGIIASIIYCFAVKLLNYLHIDDPLDSVPISGFCGLWGVIAVAFFKKD